MKWCAGFILWSDNARIWKRHVSNERYAIEHEDANTLEGDDLTKAAQRAFKIKVFDVWRRHPGDSLKGAMAAVEIEGRGDEVARYTSVAPG